jgi:hypothetical protein
MGPKRGVKLDQNLFWIHALQNVPILDRAPKFPAAEISDDLEVGYAPVDDCPARLNMTANNLFMERSASVHFLSSRTCSSRVLMRKVASRDCFKSPVKLISLLSSNFYRSKGLAKVKRIS